MNTDLSLQKALVDVLPLEKKSTTLMEISKITDCPICSSFQKVSISKNTTRKSTDLEKKCPVCGKNCGKPSLLDLFSGAGGAARGYQKAGFCVLGIDIKPQPHYAGCRFIQADALTYPLEGFDAYHASPPCQRYSRACIAARTNHKYPDLLPATRERLESTNKVWAIENVPNAPMRPDCILCGSHFGLPIVRHRLFETNPKIFVLLPPCNHVDAPIGIYGHGTNSWYRRKTGHNASTQDWRNAMGIQWMTKVELAEAIPPAYTEYIGKYLLKACTPTHKRET